MYKVFLVIVHFSFYLYFNCGHLVHQNIMQRECFGVSYIFQVDSGVFSASQILQIHICLLDYDVILYPQSKCLT